MLAAVPACPNCATDNPDIARFCLACGARLDPQSPIAPLKERKVIEKAKGILMKSRGLDEEAAYALLRKTAMSSGKRIAAVAESLVSTFDLLKD